jgi:hypothetical protein
MTRVVQRRENRESLEIPESFGALRIPGMNLKRQNGRAGEARPTGIHRAAGVKRLVVARMSLLMALIDETRHICIDKTLHI